MFTIEQIKEARARVKTGADFPDFVQDLMQLGVNGFEFIRRMGTPPTLGMRNTPLSRDQCIKE